MHKIISWVYINIHIFSMFSELNWINFKEPKFFDCNAVSRIYFYAKVRDFQV